MLSVSVREESESVESARGTFSQVRCSANITHGSEVNREIAIIAQRPEAESESRPARARSWLMLVTKSPSSESVSDCHRLSDRISRRPLLLRSAPATNSTVLSLSLSELRRRDALLNRR